MPLKILSGAEAMANVKVNGESSWPARGELGSRLEPLARPSLRPGFRFTGGERIFTIGSCFARNVELVLEQCGFALPTRDIIRADPEFAVIGHNILNNYGAPAILNEIRWALDPAHPFDEAQAFFEIYPGKWIDVHLNHALKPAPIETVRARRRAILNVYRGLAECRVTIITLGLAECWLDRVTGIYLNTAPRRSMIRAFPDRFELHVLSYEEIHKALVETLALIRAHGHPDAHVILTVSPVPLAATFRDEDVMIANAYSKAVLRAATEAVVMAHDFVDYYPSYESVTLSERAAALEADQVHPTRAVIEINTSRMIRAYVGVDALGDAAIGDAIAENPQAALSLLAEREDLVAADPTLALALFGAAVRGNRMDLLARAIPHLAGTVPDDEVKLARARVALAAGDAAGALALLDREPLRRGVKSNFWSARIDAAIMIGDLEAARAAARGWAEFNVRTPEPFRRLALALGAQGLDMECEAMFQAALAAADDDPKTLLDYAEMLRRTGRHAEADPILAGIEPVNPAQTERLTRLRLWSEGVVAARPAPEPEVAPEPEPPEPPTPAAATPRNREAVKLLGGLYARAPFRKAIKRD